MDQYHLERFVQAQRDDYDIALREMKAGKKCSHWIWYIFPQLKQLGRSYMAKEYGISGIKEAEAYLAHPVLRKHLEEITDVIISLPGHDSFRLMGGSTDSLKLKSSMTLFDFVSNDDRYRKVLDKYYHGQKDHKTIEILQQEIISSATEEENNYETMCGRCRD